MKVLLEGIVGSHAYGTNHEESDVDKAGVFLHSTPVILGIPKYQETVTRTNGIDKGADPDYSYHEVGKYLRLAIAGNPTVQELMWLPEHTIMTWEGHAIVGARQMILSQKVRKTYGGYAKQQFLRSKRRGDGSFSSTTRNRTFKHARHCMRLLLQCEDILNTGILTVRMSNDQIQQTAEFAQLAVDDLDAFESVVTPHFTLCDEMSSDLPREPDVSYVNDMLITIRKGNWND